MPKDRDQLTPDDPDDREQLEHSRGQGTGSSGRDRLAGEEPRPPIQAEEAVEEETDESIAADPTRPGRPAEGDDTV